MNKKSYITPASKVVELGEEVMLANSTPQNLGKAKTTSFFSLDDEEAEGPAVQSTVNTTGAGWNTFDNAD